ncbi:nitroreductase family protein [Tunicatimonas pelagia]|uniref:nitroreductase family protein n=1 Tax=Tunicatimonas pelagia TaxID=931531 RepID=UPI00266691DE|nr:nitroreductase [Tunicatimonas pelagia]WKN46150.1 nitroreductase [Tunicatimonas pelagia]
MNITPEQATELIQNRRSLYPAVFNKETIDDTVIQAILENANWAPTHRLTQPWRFTVFSGGGLQKLANFQADLYKKVTEVQGSFDQKKYEKLQKKPLLCSHIIAIGMKRDPKARVPEIEEVMATACAVQNMYLTASAYEVGGYWGTGGVTYYEEAKSFFGLEAEDKLLGFFYLGMPKTDKWPEGRRDAISEKVSWVRE